MRAFIAHSVRKGPGRVIVMHMVLLHYFHVEARRMWIGILSECNGIGKRVKVAVSRVNQIHIHLLREFTHTSLLLGIMFLSSLHKHI